MYDNLGDLRLWLYGDPVLSRLSHTERCEAKRLQGGCQTAWYGTRIAMNSLVFGPLSVSRTHVSTARDGAEPLKVPLRFSLRHSTAAHPDNADRILPLHADPGRRSGPQLCAEDFSLHLRRALPQRIRLPHVHQVGLKSDPQSVMKVL